MSGDGFSVKTTISQMSNVARALQKSQQLAQPESAATGHLLKGEKRVDRIQQSDEAQKANVDPEHRRRDGGREHRDHRDQDGAEAATGVPETDGTPDTAPVVRIDTTA
ncbi:MAG: hypothetical protein IPI34_03560 [bacterium]|nr:hypothetical protein [bacterium]